MSETYFCNDDCADDENAKIALDYTKKRVEELESKNEKLEQEIYDLRRKLNSNEKMLAETMEFQEHSANQTIKELKQKIEQTTGKFNQENAFFTKQVEELQLELSSKQNEITKQKEMLNEMHTKSPTKSIPSEPLTSDSFAPQKYESQIENLVSLLETETSEHSQLKEAYFLLSNEVASFRETLDATQKSSEEKNEVMESLREELAVCQSELNVLKSNPTSASSKGNSIFAELEDSRNKMIEKMKIMQSKYISMKRDYSTKEAEIEKMKVEKAALIRMWEEDSMKIMAQGKELENAYEDKGLHLEKQLKNVQAQLDKLLDSELQRDNISFLQIQVVEQKKEINKLRSQIDNDYIQKCVEQEQMKKLLNEVRLWKYRALTKENTTTWNTECSKSAVIGKDDLSNKNEMDLTNVNSCSMEETLLPAKRVKFNVESIGSTQSENNDKSKCSSESQAKKLSTQEGNETMAAKCENLPRKSVKKSHPTVFISSVTE